MRVLLSTLLFVVCMAAAYGAADTGRQRQQTPVPPKTIRVPLSQKKIRSMSTLTNKHHKRALYKESIYNDFGSVYMVDVSIGTPPQTFQLAVDTGSADLWIPGSNCPTSSCPYTKFVESNSSTFVSLKDTFAIEYGIGSVNGTYATDTITVAGATVAKQQFGLASATAHIMEQPDLIDINVNSNSTTVQNNETVAMNGIFGLGYPRLTRAYSQGKPAYNPFVFNLVTQKLIDDPVFSIFLNSISEEGWSGEILFGGYDQSKFEGNLTYLNVAGLTAQITSPDGTGVTTSNGYYYWMVYAQGLGVRNPVSANGKSMTWHMADVGAFILDTGTTLTYFPESVASEIVTAFVGAGNFTLDSQFNVYVIDCAAAKNSSFRFELILSRTSNFKDEQPVIVSIPAKELVVSMEEKSVEESQDCMFGIAPLARSSTLSSSNTYLIGESVLRSLYMVYDIGKNRVGLAANKNMGGSVTVGSWDAADVPSTSSTPNKGMPHPTTTSEANMARAIPMPAALLVLLSVILYI